MFEGEVVDKVAMDVLICLYGARGADCNYSSNGLLQVVFVYPGIEFPDCLLEPIFQDHVGSALSF